MFQSSFLDTAGARQESFTYSAKILTPPGEIVKLIRECSMLCVIHITVLEKPIYFE